MSRENYFYEAAARSCDADAAEMFAPDTLHPAVEFLAELAGNGAVLEFGIGTGRVALYCRERLPRVGVEEGRGPRLSFIRVRVDGRR